MLTLSIIVQPAREKYIVNGLKLHSFQIHTVFLALLLSILIHGWLVAVFLSQKGVYAPISTTQKKVLLHFRVQLSPASSFQKPIALRKPLTQQQHRHISYHSVISKIEIPPQLMHDHPKLASQSKKIILIAETTTITESTAHLSNSGFQKTRIWHAPTNMELAPAS